MFIAVAILIGLAGARLLGARLSRLADLELRGTWLVFLGLAVQLAIFTPLSPSLPEAAQVCLHLATYLLLLIFLALNIRLPLLWIAAAGFASNILVIFANGGRMPVPADAWTGSGSDLSTGQAVAYNNVVAADAQTRLPWLGDIIALPDGMPLANALSIGDILLIVGMTAFVHRACRPTLHTTPPKPHTQALQ